MTAQTGPEMREKLLLLGEMMELLLLKTVWVKKSGCIVNLCGTKDEHIDTYRLDWGIKGRKIGHCKCILL